MPSGTMSTPPTGISGLRAKEPVLKAGPAATGQMPQTAAAQEPARMPTTAAQQLTSLRPRQAAQAQEAAEAVAEAAGEAEQLLPNPKSGLT